MMVKINIRPILFLFVTIELSQYVAFALSSSSHPQTSSSSTRQTHPHPFQNKIIACASSNELARAIELVVRPHDKVAELGSQLREVSTTICKSCETAVLVDVSRKMPSQHSKQASRTAAMRVSSDGFFPDKANFIEISKLSDWRSAFFGNGDETYYNVLVLDVNAIVGNDLEWTSLQLIQEFQHCNSLNSDENDLIVLVKSVGLNQFASRLVHGPKYTRGYHAIPPPHILATVGVQEYRATIPEVVSEGDAILEVGCHFGTTTCLLQQAGEYAIGVDVGSKIIKQAQSKYPDIYFQVGNAWKTALLLRIQQEYYQWVKEEHGKDIDSRRIGFDVVYIDVGGLSGADGLLEAILLVNSIQNSLEPRCIIIKSLCLQRLSTALISFWELQTKMKRISDLG